MKKLGKKFLIGTAFAVTATALVGCSPEGSVYGPPQDNFETTTEVPVCVYGPPEYFTDVTDISEEDATQEFDVETEINEDVYGPPAEDFE